MHSSFDKIASLATTSESMDDVTPRPNLSNVSRKTLTVLDRPNGSATAERETLRRQPRQDRSRERVETILQVAARLIGEKGIAAVAMKEIATECGMPLATVYHYFPHKTAIIETLYRRHYDETWKQLMDLLEKAGRHSDVSTLFESLVDRHFSDLVQDPQMQDLLNAVQADKALQNIDIDVAREQASYFSELTVSRIADVQQHDYRRLVNLFFQLETKLMRLAVTLGPLEGQKVVADYKNLVRGQLSQFDRVAE